MSKPLTLLTELDTLFLSHANTADSRPGVIPAGWMFAADSPQLAALSQELKNARQVLGLEDQPHAPLPIAVGFLLFKSGAAPFEANVLPILQEHKVQTVWLFGEEDGPDDMVRQIVDAVHRLGMRAICMRFPSVPSAPSTLASSKRESLC